MKKVILSTALAIMVAATAAGAADLKPAYKAAPPPPPPSPWDIAFGAAIMSDYNFRGISQSNKRGAVTAYFEPRYNINPNLQLYAGLGGYSIEFPNRAAAEIDFYGGIRPTFGKFAFDFGIWYYYYPDGQCFNTSPPGGAQCIAALPNGNVIKDNVSFIEYYGKLTYNFSDKLSAGVAVYYDPNWLNTGADGTYLSGTAKYVLPWTLPILSGGTGMYVSGELAHYWFGTTDAFYGIPASPFANGVPLPDYTTWNVGLGFTWKVFTLDLRYYDTDLSDANCNVLTSDHTATFSASNVTAINPGGLGSKWCGSTFIAKFSADLTYANLK